MVRRPSSLTDGFIPAAGLTTRYREWSKTNYNALPQNSKWLPLCVRSKNARTPLIGKPSSLSSHLFTQDFFDGELIAVSVISAATFETGTAKVGRPAFPGRGRRVHQCYADNRGHQLAR